MKTGISATVKKLSGKGGKGFSGELEKAGVSPYFSHGLGAALDQERCGARMVIISANSFCP
jgi:ribosomal protein L13E